MSGASDRELDKDSQRLLDAMREMRSLELSKRATERSSEEFHDLAETVVDKAKEVRKLAIEELDQGRDDSPLAADHESSAPGDWTRGSRE
jgi:hypothetical protein